MEIESIRESLRCRLKQKLNPKRGKVQHANEGPDADDHERHAESSQGLVAPILSHGDGLTRGRIDLIPGRCRGAVQGDALRGHR